MLGSSAGVPSRRRKCSSALLVSDKERVLIDCGPGTTRQLRRLGQPLEDVTFIWLSHSHMDHLLGIRRLLRRLGVVSRNAVMRIYANGATVERLNSILRFLKLRTLEVRLHVAERGIFHQTRWLAWRTFPLKHPVPTNGLVVEEKPFYPLVVDWADRLDVPEGHFRETLTTGRAVVLPNGRRVTPEEVCDPPVPGRKVVYVADTIYFDGLVDVCANADMVICESTFPARMGKLARGFRHMRADQAAWLAREAHAKRLVLTHLSRWSKSHLVEKEARAIFPHTIVAEDFSTFMVPVHRHEPPK